jgi:hypothetical protein
MVSICRAAFSQNNPATKPQLGTAPAPSRSQTKNIPSTVPNIFLGISPRYGKNKITRPLFPKRETQNGRVKNTLGNNPQILPEQTNFLSKIAQWVQTAQHPVDVPKDEEGKRTLEFTYPLTQNYSSYQRIPRKASNLIEDGLKILQKSALCDQDRKVLKDFLETYFKATLETTSDQGKASTLPFVAQGVMHDLYNPVKDSFVLHQEGNLEKQSQLRPHIPRVRREIGNFTSTINRLLKETPPAVAQQEKEMPLKDVKLLLNQ